MAIPYLGPLILWSSKEMVLIVLILLIIIINYKIKEINEPDTPMNYK